MDKYINLIDDKIGEKLLNKNLRKKILRFVQN